MNMFSPILSRLARLALCALQLLPVLPAHAADDDSPWRLGIALGAGQRSNPLVNSDDIDIHAVIDFSWYGERFFFDNGDLGFNLLEDNRFSLNLIATYNNERNFYNYLTGKDLGLNILESLGNDYRFSAIADSTDTPQLVPDDSVIVISEEGNLISAPPGLAGTIEADLARDLADTTLPSRSTAINGGFELLYLAPVGDFQAQVLTDISSTHGGQEAWLSWTKPWYFATATGVDQLAFTVGAEWKSSDLVGYYFGVRDDEAFPGRPAYAGRAGTNTFVRLSGRHVFSDHWQLVGTLEREFLSSGIKASPVVDEDTIDTVFLGLFFQF